jgi:putative ABC transport system permease protein
MIEYLRLLFKFYRRHLRVQPLRELMAVGGVAAGVALLFAVQVAHRSITGSFEEISRGVAGRATLEVAARGPEGFSESISDEIERAPGVKAAAPIIEQPIVVAGPSGRRALTLVGASEQVTALGGALSLRFLHAAESSQRGLMVLTARTATAIGVRPGENVRVLVGERTENVALDATVSSDVLGAAAESPIAAAPLAIVQSLAGLHERVTRVLVQPRPGHESAVLSELLRHYGRSLNVRPVDTEAKLLGAAAGPEKEVTLLFGAISLLAGIILAFNALLLASEERGRFITYLIEAGTPDGLIIASLAFDAFILGILGSIIGLVAGDVTSLIAYRTVPGYIAAAFAIGGQRVIDTQTVLLALGGGMAAAFMAASIPAFVILRATAATEPEGVGRALSLTRKLRVSDALVFACGAVLVCASVATALLAPSLTVVALLGLTGGLVACLPMIARYLLALAAAASQRSRDPSARLSVAELRGSPARSIALLATGTVAALLMVVIGGSVADVQHAVSRGASDLLSSASVWVKPGGPENVYTTQPFAYQETQSHLQRVGVVTSVLAWRDSFLDLPGRRVWVLGVPSQTPDQIAPSQLIEGSLAAADQHIREGGWVAVSQPIAQEKHLHIGARFELPTPAGYTSFRLAATIANYGWLPGAVLMNANDHAKLWSSDTASELAVTLRPGVSPEEGSRAVQAALPAGSGLAVKTSSERRAEASAVLGSTLQRLNDTTIVVIIATIISVIALMIGAIWQRRGRLNSLMSIGMSTGQFARLVSYESASVLLSGCLIGIVGGLVGQLLIDGWLHDTTGAPVHYDPAWQVAIQTLLIAAAISGIATLVAVVQAKGLEPQLTFSTE